MYVGIDGGGTHVRVVVCDSSLNIIGESAGAGVNPGAVGHDLAAARIEQTILAALDDAGLTTEDVLGAGAGIAGAAEEHSRAWVKQTIESVLPSARVVASADYEIALVGAVGERHGIVVISGTGSAAFGAHRGTGASMRQGGFGYLLGDEGSGYWLGREALSHALREMDGRATPSMMTRRILDVIGANHPMDVIPWLYSAPKPRVSEIAALASVVIAVSEEGDMVAQGYVARAASELAQLVRNLQKRLDLYDAPIAFVGGLLERNNRLTEVLMRRLHLTERPAAMHPPEVGAAILAMEPA
jgi:glucosamine kinase